MAVAFGHSSTGTTAPSGTSLNITHNCTGDNLLVVAVSTRLVTGGCGASDVTDFAATYNGVSMTYLKGAAGAGDSFVPASDCVYARLLYLVNPASGSNTIALTWTSSAYVAAAAISVSGYSSLGTISTSKASGTTWSSSATIGANDLIVGSFHFADSIGNQNSSDPNWVEAAANSNYISIGMATPSGTGSVAFSGTSTNFGHIVYALPVLAAASSALKTVDGLAYASVKTVDQLAVASVKSIDDLA